MSNFVEDRDHYTENIYRSGIKALCIFSKARRICYTTEQRSVECLCLSVCLLYMRIPCVPYFSPHAVPLVSYGALCIAVLFNILCDIDTHILFSDQSWENITVKTYGQLL